MYKRQDPESVTLPGVVEQVYYVGQGYRYRVRTADAQVWVQAPDRLAEGTSASVVVPRAALLIFPAHGPSTQSTPPLHH